MGIRRLFVEHPASVNETYLEHMGVATSFGSRMIVAGVACMIHGLLPFLFLTTGSRTVTELQERMVTHRVRNPDPSHAAAGAGADE